MTENNMDIMSNMGGINANEFLKDVDHVNKLSSATTKLFSNAAIIGGGSNKADENFFPEIKDVLNK